MRFGITGLIFMARLVLIVVSHFVLLEQDSGRHAALRGSPTLAIIAVIPIETKNWNERGFGHAPVYGNQIRLGSVFCCRPSWQQALLFKGCRLRHPANRFILREVEVS